MPDDTVQKLKAGGWGLTDKCFSQCVGEVGSNDFKKVQEYLLDVRLPNYYMYYLIYSNLLIYI